MRLEPFRVAFAFTHDISHDSPASAMGIFENLGRARTRQTPPGVRTRILTGGIIDIARLGVDDIRLSDARATSEFLRTPSPMFRVSLYCPFHSGRSHK